MKLISVTCDERHSRNVLSNAVQMFGLSDRRTLRREVRCLDSVIRRLDTIRKHSSSSERFCADMEREEMGDRVRDV